MSNYEELSSSKGINKFLKRDNIILNYVLLVAITLVVVIAAILAFYNSVVKKETILSNVYIKGIDVSNLNKQEAITKVETQIKEKMNNHIILKYNNYQFYVEPEQFNANFDIESAVDYAYNICKKDSFFENMKNFIGVKFKGLSIEPTFTYNRDELAFFLENIQDELPDQLEQSSYYINKDELIITSGKNGAVIYKDKLIDNILNEIENLSFDNSIYEIPTYTIYPDKINVQNIHDDVYREMKNASFTKDPYQIFVEQDGIDFDANSVQTYINENPNADEYVVGLTISKPEVTIDDLGIDAFPNMLSSYATKYVNNANRTTNLRLAAAKINSKVVMPGETFSFNKVVGQRTAAAGYKNAAIFVNGSVEDGLAGGICQISTTLYNAANLADLEVTERRNHSMLSSYAEPRKRCYCCMGI